MEVAEAQELFDLHPDIDIFEKDIFGFSWLSSALAQGNMELVKFLLEKTNAPYIHEHTINIIFRLLFSFYSIFYFIDGIC